jgi:hypothetical protein
MISNDQIGQPRAVCEALHKAYLGELLQATLRLAIGSLSWNNHFNEANR